MWIRLREPRRPEVEDPRAKFILDWVQTLAFIFWTVFSIVVAIVIFIEGNRLITSGIPFLR
jgi:hypothetical protein